MNNFTNRQTHRIRARYFSLSSSSVNHIFWRMNQFSLKERQKSERTLLSVLGKKNLSKILKESRVSDRRDFIHHCSMEMRNTYIFRRWDKVMALQICYLLVFADWCAANKQIIILLKWWMVKQQIQPIRFGNHWNGFILLYLAHYSMIVYRFSERHTELLILWSLCCEERAHSVNSSIFTCNLQHWTCKLCEIYEKQTKLTGTCPN